MAVPHKTTSDTDTIKQIMYIKQKVSELTVNDRKTILKILIKSGVDDHKIHSKGNGTQVKFKDIPPNVITELYEYVKEKMSSKLESLKTFTEANNEDLSCL
jgi:hypothetical protein